MGSTTLFSDWLVQPARVAFGHAKLPNLEPLARLKSIADGIKGADFDQQSHLTVFVLPTEFERLMLLERIKTEAAELDIASVAVHSFASLLQTWHSSECAFLQSKSLAIICECDGYYSAEFCLGMIETMYAERTQRLTRTTRYRILMMSFLQDPEQSLVEALRLICPPIHGIDRVVLQSPSALEQAVKTVNKAELLAAVTREYAEILKKKRAMLILCCQNTADDIYEKFGDTYARYYYNEMPHWMSLQSASRDTFCQATIIFLTGPIHVPFRPGNLHCIFIEGVRDAAVWERGRIVHKTMPLSDFEINDAKSYKMQSYFGDHMALYMLPEASGLKRQFPSRRVANDQSWGFVASIASRYDDLPFATLSMIFVRNRIVFETTLTHFATMGFIQDRPGDLVREGIRPYRLSAEAGDMTMLLGRTNHDFHVAWFLAIGMKMSDMSKNAKRAMLRIGSLAMSRFRALHAELVADQLSYARTSPRDFTAALQKKAEGHFTMPSHLYLHGVVWLALAVLQVALRTEPVIRSRADVCDLPWHDVPGVWISVEYIRHIFRTVRALDMDNVESAKEMAEPLHLTEDDCRSIQGVLVRTLLHKTILMQSVELEKVEKGTRALKKTQSFESDDIVTGMTNLCPKETEVMMPWAVMGTPGTLQDWVIFASFEVHREADGRLYFSNSVVLPVDRVDAWRIPDGEPLVHAVAHRQACPIAAQGLLYGPEPSD